MLYKTTYTNNINGSIKIIKTEGKINIITLFIHTIKKRLFKISKLKEYLIQKKKIWSKKARVD